MTLRLTRVLLPVYLVGALAACAPHTAGEGGAGTATFRDPGVIPAPASLDSLLSPIRKEHEVPALAAAVVRGNSIVAAGAVGVRRLGASRSVRPTDAFHVGSIAKSMTATMIATLVEEGKLSWNSTPLEVFPELTDSIHPALRENTLKQLLAHTAGLAAFHPGTPEFDAIPELHRVPAEQRRQFVQWVLKRAPALAPGSGFLYSNAGGPVAAAMAERVTGQSWEALLRERIFQPLAMETAGIGWPASTDPTQPWGHWEIDGELKPHDPSDEYQIPPWNSPAGDVHMSILDLARYAAIHLQGLRGQESLLRPETFRILHTPLALRTEQGYQEVGYALGWNVRGAGGGPGSGLSYHTGGAGTFVAVVWISPERDLAFVTATNSGEGVRALSATRRALEELFGTL